MNDWLLVYDSFEPEQERLREALCTLGNGYFATRGAAAESRADSVHYPGTYVAGAYNRLTSRVNGVEIENESLVNMPNWLSLRLRINDGDWISPHSMELLSYRQELDLRSGILTRSLRVQDRQRRRSRLEERRLVHMADPHIAALHTTLIPENWSGRVEIVSGLDGRVVNTGVERYRGLANEHLVPVDAHAAGDEGICLKVKTCQSELNIAESARTRLYLDGQPLPTEGNVQREEGLIEQHFALDLEEGHELAVEKVVALHTSRDSAISECGLAACKQIHRAPDFRTLCMSHGSAWKHLWTRFDANLEFTERDDENNTLLTTRLHLFHLLQTASPHVMDLDVGVPARGLHGEAYRGHIFWDELFIFPTLNLRLPEITRSLLMYRYRRLDEARWNALSEGYHGAMYPWQSASDGREESQTLHLNPASGRWVEDDTSLQRHVNAAIAYNIWQYYQVTRDMEFLSYHGAVIIVEIARLWASLAHYDENTGRFGICGVIGPDEFHTAYPDSERPGLNNHAYTNVMAVWTLCRALDLLEILDRGRVAELREHLQLGDDELNHWDRISRKMNIPFHSGNIISQFEGYDDLEEFDWEGYRATYGDIQRLDRILEAEGDSPNRYKVSKQADVLMLFYLFSTEELAELFQRLGYAFDPRLIPDNIEYYIRRTSNGSTLSRVVHSWVLARSDRARSWRLFSTALESDVADIQGGTTEEGIHLGAMAGTVDLIQRAYTGIVTREDAIWLDPQLPEELRRLNLRIRYRSHTLDVDITHTSVRVCTLRGSMEPINVGFRGELRELRADEVCELFL